jgi:hypothetical protein
MIGTDILVGTEIYLHFYFWAQEASPSYSHLLLFELEVYDLLLSVSQPLSTVTESDACVRDLRGGLVLGGVRV